MIITDNGTDCTGIGLLLGGKDMKTNKYVSKRRQSMQLLNVTIHVGEKILNIYSSYFNMLTPQKLNHYYNVESDRNKRDILKQKRLLVKVQQVASEGFKVQLIGWEQMTPDVVCLVIPRFNCNISESSRWKRLKLLRNTNVQTYNLCWVKI